MTRWRILPLSLLAATAAASEVATLYLPDFDGSLLRGEVIGSHDAVTTYVLHCASGELCGLPTSDFTITQGPSTYAAAFDFPESTICEACGITSSTTLSCHFTVDYLTSTETQTSVFVSKQDDIYQTVTITGTGAAPAQTTSDASSTAETTSAAHTSSVDSKTTTSTPSTTKEASTGASTSASTTTSASHSTNAGFPQATYNAWAVGGAAAIAVGVMM